MHLTSSHKAPPASGPGIELTTSHCEHQVDKKYYTGGWYWWALANTLMKLQVP